MNATNQEPEPKNPFPPGSVAASRWESEQARIRLHERTIKLLSGELIPENEQDKNYLRDMGGVRGKNAGWPKRWVTCERCHCDWLCTAFPAPSQSAKYQFSFSKNRLGAWLWPGICEKCDEELHAVKTKPAPSTDSKKKKIRDQYAD